MRSKLLSKVVYPINDQRTRKEQILFIDIRDRYTLIQFPFELGVAFDTEQLDEVGQLFIKIAKGKFDRKSLGKLISKTNCEYKDFRENEQGK